MLVLSPLYPLKHVYPSVSTVVLPPLSFARGDELHTRNILSWALPSETRTRGWYATSLPSLPRARATLNQRRRRITHTHTHTHTHAHALRQQ